MSSGMSPNSSMHTPSSHCSSHAASSSNSNAAAAIASAHLHAAAAADHHDDYQRTVLVEGGKLLSGSALREYATQKGLCQKCLHHVTHKKIRKRVGVVRYTFESIPLTVTDDLEGNYTVYKGYCLQPTCWTMNEVQAILGETPTRSTVMKSASMRKGMSSASASGSRGNSRTPSRRRGSGDNGGGEQQQQQQYSMEQRAQSRGRDPSRSRRTSERTAGGPHGEANINNSGAGVDSNNSRHSRRRDSGDGATTPYRRRDSPSSGLSTGTTAHQQHQQHESNRDYRSRHFATPQGDHNNDGGASGTSAARDYNRRPASHNYHSETTGCSSAARANLDVGGGDRSYEYRHHSRGRPSQHHYPAEQQHAADRAATAAAVTNSRYAHAQHLQQESVAGEVASAAAMDSGNATSQRMRRSSVAQVAGPRTNSTRNLAESKRSALSRAASARNTNINNSLLQQHQCYSSRMLPEVQEGQQHQQQQQQHQQQQHQLEAPNRRSRQAPVSHRSESTMQQQQQQQHIQRPRGASIGNEGMATTTTIRQNRQRKAVPDVAILQQLCRLGKRGGLSSASDMELWSSLNKRHGDGSTLVIDTATNKIVLVLRIMQALDDPGCLAYCWTLLCGLTRQADSTNDGIVRKILYVVTVQLDRVNYDDASGNCQKYAASTLFHMLKAEEHSFDSQVLDLLQSLGTVRRHHWIAVLLDMLMFQDEEQEDENATTETLFVVWNLLLSQPVSVDDDYTTRTEEMVLLKTVVGISVSLLSNDSSLYNANEQGRNAGGVLMSETALGLLATVASRRGGSTALAGRQNECVRIVYETMQRHPESDVMLQGAQAIRHILATYNWFEQQQVTGESPEFCDVSVSPTIRVAELIVEVVMLILSYLSAQASNEFDEEEGLCSTGCQLLTALFESNDEVRSFVVESQLCKDPKVVQVLARIIETTEHVGLAESASELLVFLINLDFTTRGNLRQTEDVASKLIFIMERHYSSPLVQESLCLMVADLAALEDHCFGREVGAAGGLDVITALLGNVEQHGSVIVAASRCLVGILSSVDRDMLRDHQVSLSKVSVDVMENNVSDLAVQLAGLDILNCLCIRGDCSESHLIAAVPALVDAMDNHLASETLLMKCCSIVRMLGRASNEYGIFVDTGAMKIIISAMLIHPESVELVMEGMAALKDFAAEPTFRDHFNQSDAQDAVVSLLEANMCHPDVVSLAFATLNNVVVDSRDRVVVAPMSISVLGSVISALRIYATDEKVFSYACLLLKSYTYEEESLQVMREQSSDLIPLLVGSSLSKETNDRAQSIMCKLYGKNGFRGA